MSKPSNPSRFSEPAPSPPRRRALRCAAAERQLRILERLTAGAAIAQIALAEDLTPRRVRQIIAATLASRDVEPPAGFIPLQIGRLSDAMRVAHAKMMAGDLQALDRVIKIVGQLDRYHGFGQAETAAASAAQKAEAEIFRPATP